LALIADDHNFLASVIHLNMAAALLELKRYPETIMHAEKALNGGANKQKAFYR
jgi:alkylhydroperoxidase/carboxymuconolactone decarboxylase family protein YurZ